MNAKVTASAAASLAPSLTAADALYQDQVAGSSTRLPYASIIAAAFLADGRAVLGSRSDFNRPDRGTHRRVEAEFFRRYLHALDAAGGQGKPDDRLFHLGDLMEFGDTGKMFTNPEDCRTESYITGRIG